MYLVETFLILFPFFIWIGLASANVGRMLDYAIFHFYVLGVFVSLGVGFAYYNLAFDGKYFLESLFVVWPPAILGIFLLAGKGMSLSINFDSGVSESSQSSKFVFATLTLLGAVIFARYLYLVGSPALIELLVNGGDGYIIRQSKSTDIAGGFFLYSILFNHLPLLMISLLILHWKGTVRQFFLLLLILCLSMLTLQKAGLIWSFFVLLVTGIFVKRRVNWSLLLAFPVALFFLVAVSLAVYYPEREFLQLLLTAPGFVMRRLAETYAYAHLFSLENIPQNISFFYGRTLANPFGLFDFEQVNYGRLLGEMINGMVAQNYSYSTFTEMYVNFGNFGIVIVHLLIVLKLCIVQIVCLKVRIPAKIRLSIYIYFCMQTLQYAMAPYQDVMAIKTYLLTIFTILMYFLWLSFKQFMRTRYVRGMHGRFAAPD